jgi:hypothetical protein
MASVFIHVTVVPTETSTSSGLNALFPSVDAPTGMVTDDAVGPGAGAGAGAGAGDGDGVGDGAGDGYDELLPQAAANNRIAGTRARRDDNIKSSNTTTGISGAPEYSRMS